LKNRLSRLLGFLLTPRVTPVLIYLGSPKFTVGSMVIWTERDRVLLVRSRYGERAWGFPGGVMKRHEDPVDCALRELREETGISAITPDDLALVGTHTQKTTRHVDHVYRLQRAHDPRSDGEVADQFEIAEVKWWPTDALPVLRREARTAIERYGL
jgi:ADP-ribose pyrophosphatase YjhB (NUDIX family)